MKIHCEQTDFGYLSVSRQTLTNVTFNRHLVASCCQWSCVVATIIAKAKMYLKVPFLGLGFNREWGNWRWIPAPFPHPSRMAIPSLSRPLPFPGWGLMKNNVQRFQMHFNHVQTLTWSLWMSSERLSIDSWQQSILWLSVSYSGPLATAISWYMSSSRNSCS